MRIAIIGYSGSGKSTLARFLGELYGIPVLHLDRVQFLPDWKERDREEASEIVAEFMKQESWVIDGNYSGFYLKERLQAADQIIFMNFNRFACFFRALMRAVRYHNRVRPDMAEGCAEKMDAEFAWWILYQGRTKKRREKYALVVKHYREKTKVIWNQRELDAFKRRIGFQSAD